MLQQGQPWKDCSSPFVNKAMLVWRWWCTFFCCYLFCFRAISDSAQHLLLTFHFGITPDWAWGIICVTWNWTWLVSNLPILLSVWLQRSTFKLQYHNQDKSQRGNVHDCNCPSKCNFPASSQLVSQCKDPGDQAKPIPQTLGHWKFANSSILKWRELGL